MKDKDKQIEEMAKVMCGNDCEECAKESANFYGQTLEEARNNKCLLKNCAKTLYEQGYRKFPEDIIVLNIKDLEEACNTFDWVTNYKILKHQEEALKRCEQKVKQARKETAEKILEMFKSWEDKPYVSKEDFKRSIADLFGVEIKEQEDER